VATERDHEAEAGTGSGTEVGAGSEHEAERETIRRCQAGDRTAYAALVQRVQRRALHVALRMLRDADEAQEAVQDSLVRAWERIHQLDPDRPFFPWLRTIVKNDCLKRLARSKRHVSEDRAPAGRTGDPAQDAAVRDALAHLTEPDREILLLKHVEGYRYDELAARLHIPRGTVMSRLHTARARLRARLEESP